MFFSSKSLVILILFCSSFNLGFSKDEKKHKGNSNNYSIDQNLSKTTRANECTWAGGCDKSLCWAYRYFKTFGPWCHTTRTRSGFADCNRDSDCYNCWSCRD